MLWSRHSLAGARCSTTGEANHRPAATREQTATPRRTPPVAASFTTHDPQPRRSGLDTRSLALAARPPESPRWRSPASEIGWCFRAASTTCSKTTRSIAAPSRRTSRSRSRTRPVEPYLAGSPRPVPAAGPDIHPVPADRFSWLRSRSWSLLVSGSVSSSPPRARDHEHRPVLAAAGVLLERHPRPDHLTGVGASVRAGRYLTSPPPVSLSRGSRGSGQTSRIRGSRTRVS